MDAHALAVLEFPAIVERLAAATSSELGAILAAAVSPSSDAEVVAGRQSLTAEAVALLERAAEPDLGGIADLREEAAFASRGGALGPGPLRGVAHAIRVGLSAREGVIAERECAPSLAALLDVIDPALGAVATVIDRSVEEDGSDVRDSASSRLRSLRQELRRGAVRARAELERLARDPALREHLQEEFVTERAGRPVLAVRASSRGRVPGIVHDSSGSGQTLFVEPFAVVELSNRLSEAAAAEREEVERILRELSALVGAHARELAQLVEATAAVDLALACGTISRRWRGTPVTVADEIVLRGARHPLLDPAAAVAIDLELGSVRALVVSGPNTGGKTVALKTLGLAALLHQSGLRPPALEATLPVFDLVLADIGDEQSIEMSLSTFSGHLRNLIGILAAATGESLVLLDELASGTDPVEGSALAQAILARLADQARLTAVTTHYPELKEWASSTEGATNAATAFDPETYAPLYTVTLGRPGSSQALRIAARLGLDESIVERARELVAPERLQVAALLADAEAAERSARATWEDAEASRAEAQRIAAALEAREAELLEEIETVRAAAAGEREAAVARVERELVAAREELKGLRDEIRLARRREQERQRARAGSAVPAERERDRRLGKAADRAAAAERALRSLAPVPLLVPLAVGDPVEAADIGVSGTISALEGDEAEVIGRGGLRVRVPVARLRPRAQLGGEELRAPAAPAVQVRAAVRSDVADELDVRGMTGHEAREAVRALVDAGSLAGLPQVRVIHGRGTGALRRAVRDELARHPLVGASESDSADGATVVHLGVET